jgi:hypothetical protein
VAPTPGISSRNSCCRNQAASELPESVYRANLVLVFAPAPISLTCRDTLGAALPSAGGTLAEVVELSPAGVGTSQVSPASSSSGGISLADVFCGLRSEP